MTYLNPGFITRGLGILFAGLTIRIIVSTLCVCTDQFEGRERLFIALAWLPKATVQAALGSVALDAARSMATVNPDHERWGIQILTLAVLAIIVTAPVGAVLIALCGPRLLRKEGAQL